MVFVLVLSGCAPLQAEKLSLDKAFDKLVAHCADFKPLYATGEPSGFEFPSTMEIDRAQRSYIRKVGDEIVYVAEFGTFDTQRKADDYVKTMEAMFRSAKPSFKFASGFNAAIRGVIDYFYDGKATGFRLYKACFKQVRTGNYYQVTFEFPQTGKKTASAIELKEEMPSYLDYTTISVERDESEFSRSFHSILDEALLGFITIKGDYAEGRNSPSYYKASLKPAGYTDCFLEQVGADKYRYVMEICQGVTKAKLDATVKDMLNKLYRAFGTDYAVAVYNAQKKYIFVNKSDPDREVADLVIKQSKQENALTLFIPPGE